MTGAIAENVSRPVTEAFEEVNNSQAFTVERKQNNPFFLDERLSGAPKHIRTVFSPDIRRTESVGSMFRQFKRPKSDVHKNQVVSIRSHF